MLQATQRVWDTQQSQTMFIGRLLCGARISERQSSDAVGLLDAGTNSLAPIYRLVTLVGGTAVLGCSLAFWKMVLH